MKRRYKTRVNPKIKNLAGSMGIEFRIGKAPEDIGVIVDNMPKKGLGAYLGNGLVFIKDRTTLTPKELDFVFLHEMGHAIMAHFLGGKINTKSHEVSANAIALGFAAVLGIPVSERMLNNCVAYTKARSFDRIAIKGIK